MPARGRKKAVVAVSPEVKARAEKMRKEGKSYKDIADALKLGYDKAAWNLLNPGPTGRHRGEGTGKKPSQTAGKGRKVAGRPKAAEGSVEARRTVKKSGKKAPQPPTKAPEESAPVEGSGNQPGSLTRRFGTGQDRPVARPSEPTPNGEEVVRAVPKPGSTRRKRK